MIINESKIFSENKFEIIFTKVAVKIAIPRLTINYGRVRERTLVILYFLFLFFYHLIINCFFDNSSAPGEWWMTVVVLLQWALLVVVYFKA